MRVRRGGPRRGPGAEPLALTDSTLALRTLIEGAWRQRRLIAACGGTITLAFLALGLALPPRFVSHSTLVLLLGPEYTVRSAANAGPSSNTAFDPDRILGTETEILSSDDLHRDVIRAVGLRRLYPKLLEAPSLPARLIAAVKGVPDTLARLVGSEPARLAAPDPTEDAVAIFATKLTVRPSKLASAIALGFTHRDPAVARDALLALERLYLQRRRTLYGRQDSQAMHRDVVRARTALDEADAALAAFRASHALPDYDTQLATLLRARGDIEHDAIDARRAQAAGDARIEALEGERLHLTPTVSGGSDSSLDAHLAPIRDGLEALRARAAETLARYRAGSPAALDVEAQLAARSGELAAAQPASLSATHTVRNPAFDATLGTLIDLRAAARGLAAELADDGAEEVAVSRRIAALSDNQRTLDRLTTRRGVLLDDLRDLEAAASRQADIEAVEAAARPAVRIAAAPSLPVHPLPLRLLLTLAGLILGGLAAAAAALGLHAVRRTVLLPGEIEALGIPVLACVTRDALQAAFGRIVPLGGGA